MSEQAVDKKPIASMGKVERVQLVNQNSIHNNGEEDQLSEEEQTNIDKGLNKDGSAKAAPAELTEDKKKENIAAGLNEDGSAKITELTEQEKKANLDKGLNEDGTAKIIELTADQKAANVTKGLNEDGTPKAIDDAAVLAYLKSKGKDINSIDDINKQTKDLTPEEKKAAEDTLDKKRLDWFVAHGGTVDSYAAMKIVATSDLTQLSEKELEKELTDAGFTEEEKKAIRAERYYQLDEGEIETLTDPKEKELAKKKKDFGTKKLNAKASHKQKLAVGFFETIDKALKEQDVEAADEIELAHKVDSHFQTVPGKITLQMGKTKENIDIAPLEIDVPVEILAEVRDSLKITDKRNKILFNEDDSYNIVGLTEILVRNKVLETAVNKSYLKGVSDNTAEFEKTFPIRSQNAIGLSHLPGSGNKGKAKGKIASFGKSTRVQTASSAT